MAENKEAQAVENEGKGYVTISNVLTNSIRHRTTENNKKMTTFMVPGVGDNKGEWVNAAVFGDVNFHQSKFGKDEIDKKTGEPKVDKETGEPIKQMSFGSIRGDSTMTFSRQVKDENGKFAQEQGEDGKMHNVYETIGKMTVSEYKDAIDADRAAYKAEHPKAKAQTKAKATKAKTQEAR